MCGAIDRVLADTELRQAHSRRQSQCEQRLAGAEGPVAAAATTISGIFRGSSERTKELHWCSSIQGTAHAQLKHRDSSCCNGSCLIVRTATRRVPAAVHEGENEKEKTKCSTRFPNGRLLLETTTCSSSTRYARIRLARTRKGSDCRHSTGGGAPGPCACLADFPVGGF